MTFPSNPADQQTATISGIIYQYNSADNSWTKTGNVSAFSVEGNLTVNGSVLSTSVYADQYFFSNGTPFISGGGTSANAWTIITANYTATSGDRLFANTALGEITVTLPSAPVQGDTIQIVDAYNFATNSLIVNPGTNTIEGYGSELEVDIAAVDLEFVYAENTWQLISSVGPQGIQGNTGYTGSQGQQGIAGYTGSAGADGIIGQDGYTGSQGDLGYTGSQGDQGTSGYTGSQGETGLGFAIAKSYNSVAALTADTSPTGITAGQFAIIETGDVEDPENSRLYLWNGTVYSYISDLSGNIGLTGPQGTIGYTGSAGSLGYTGSQGIAGYVGSQGIVSYTVSATAPTSPENGELWYDSSTDILYVYVNDSVSSYWLDISTGVPGPSGYTGSAGSLLDAWTKQTANYVASSGNRIIADTSAGAFDITLPASPSTGDYVIITDGYNFSTNSITILNNGSTIEGQSSNVVINVGSVDLEFVYDGATWQIISTSGPTGYTGSRGQDGTIGVDGYTGSQGDIGYTGSRGQDGTIGVDGYTGSQGQQGNIGYTGSQGIQGNIGYTGSQGIIGYTGSQGIIGGVTYNVTNSGTSAYVILGENNPNITLARGITYYFDINASGHPFWIKTAQTTGNLDAYTSGVTNNGVDIGVVTFTVPLDAPSTLYYICQFHASMVGTFTIRNIGELGYTGSQGLIGYTGSQGIQGTEGNIGPIGYTGSAGTGGGGGEGYTGSQGLPGALASSQYLDTFTGNGVQTAFTLSVAPVGVNQTTVTIDGITQIRSSYTLSGPVLTFSEAPALDDTIEVVSVLYGTTSFVDRQYTGNGAATTFTVTDGVTANSVLVMDNGLVQRPGVDYTVSGNVVVFAEAPADQNAISIRELPAGAVGYTGSAGAGGSAGDILSPFLLMGG
jgi:collagen type VII alpha